MDCIVNYMPQVLSEFIVVWIRHAEQPKNGVIAEDNRRESYMRNLITIISLNRINI